MVGETLLTCKPPACGSCSRLAAGRAAACRAACPRPRPPPQAPPPCPSYCRAAAHAHDRQGQAHAGSPDCAHPHEPKRGIAALHAGVVGGNGGVGSAAAVEAPRSDNRIITP